MVELDEGITLRDVKNRTGMSIKFDTPPNIDAINDVFPGVRRDCYVRGIFFAWGDTIYNPSRRTIPMEILAHESVHAIQQEAIGVEKWWDDYLADKAFRFDQELRAHQIEYQKFVEIGYGRTERRRALAFISERLAGPLYGHMTTKDKAKRLIKEFADG